MAGVECSCVEGGLTVPGGDAASKTDGRYVLLGKGARHIPDTTTSNLTGIGIMGTFC